MWTLRGQCEDSVRTMMTGDIYNEDMRRPGTSGHNTAQYSAQVLVLVHQYSEGATLTLTLTPPQLIVQ